jgi:hypothetical protein
MYKRLATVLAAMALGLVAAPSTASAADSYPCLWNGQSSWSAKYYCPLINGSIPVYESPYSGRGIVGWLVGGNNYRNWFISQTCFPRHPYYMGIYGNGWYAHTMADNGEWGYVSVVHFKGGRNWEPDGGLPRMNAGSDGWSIMCTPI